MARFQRPEARQSAAGHGRVREDCRLWSVQGGDGIWRPDGHVLWHPRVPCSGSADRDLVHSGGGLVGPWRAHL